jgi:hypothetical protein
VAGVNHGQEVLQTVTVRVEAVAAEGEAQGDKEAAGIFAGGLKLRIPRRCRAVVASARQRRRLVWMGEARTSRDDLPCAEPIARGRRRAPATRGHASWSGLDPRAAGKPLGLLSALGGGTPARQSTSWRVHGLGACRELLLCLPLGPLAQHPELGRTARRGLPSGWPGSVAERGSKIQRDGLRVRRGPGSFTAGQRGAHATRSDSAARAQSGERTFSSQGAERVGFEPTVAQRTTTVFETAPFNHSGTSPKSIIARPSSRSLRMRSSPPAAFRLRSICAHAESE